LQNFETGFVAYAVDEGDFPNDSHIVFPDLPKMAVYIQPGIWEKPTPPAPNFISSNTP
jgi:hypothetical protein